MMIVKSFSPGPAKAGVLRSLCDADTIAVVRPEKVLEELFRDVIRKAVTHKRPVTEADFAPIESYFTALSEKPAYREKVSRTLATLEGYLSEGMYIQADPQAVEDYILARCTRLCAEAVAAEAGDIPVIDGTQLVICREEGLKPYFDWEASRKEIAARLGSRSGLIVTGGYGRLSSGSVVRIGKGGANMMASLIASAVGADQIEFYVSKPRSFAGISELTYDEAAHLCAAEKAPFPSASIWPAKKASIPILVRDYAAPKDVVTRISAEASATGNSPLSGILAEKDLSLITVLGTGLLGTVGLSSSIFSALAAQGVNVRFISQSSSEYSISIAVREADRPKVLEALGGVVSGNRLMQLDDVMVLHQKAGIVTLYGSRMRNVPGISGRVFTALGSAGINIIASAQGGEELSISVVLDEADLDKAVAALLAM